MGNSRTKHCFKNALLFNKCKYRFCNVSGKCPFLLNRKIADGKRFVNAGLYSPYGMDNSLTYMVGFPERAFMMEEISDVRLHAECTVIPRCVDRLNSGNGIRTACFERCILVDRSPLI